jgi:hypothetical protein
VPSTSASRSRTTFRAAPRTPSCMSMSSPAPNAH